MTIKVRNNTNQTSQNQTNGDNSTQNQNNTQNGTDNGDGGGEEQQPDFITEDVVKMNKEQLQQISDEQMQGILNSFQIELKYFQKNEFQQRGTQIQTSDLTPIFIDPRFGIAFQLLLNNDTSQYSYDFSALIDIQWSLYQLDINQSLTLEALNDQDDVDDYSELISIGNHEAFIGANKLQGGQLYLMKTSFVIKSRNISGQNRQLLFDTYQETVKNLTSISPQQGTAYRTNFTIQLFKSNRNLQCKIYLQQIIDSNQDLQNPQYLIYEDLSPTKKDIRFYKQLPFTLQTSYDENQGNSTISPFPEFDPNFENTQEDFIFEDQADMKEKSQQFQIYAECFDFDRQLMVYQNNSDLSTQRRNQIVITEVGSVSSALQTLDDFQEEILVISNNTNNTQSRLTEQLFLMSSLLKDFRNKLTSQKLGSYMDNIFIGLQLLQQYYQSQNETLSDSYKNQQKIQMSIISNIALIFYSNYAFSLDNTVMLANTSQIAQQILFNYNLNTTQNSTSIQLYEFNDQQIQPRESDYVDSIFTQSAFDMISSLLLVSRQFNSSIKEDNNQFMLGLSRLLNIQSVNLIPGDTLKIKSSGVEAQVMKVSVRNAISNQTRKFRFQFSEELIIDIPFLDLFHSYETIMIKMLVADSGLKEDQLNVETTSKITVITVHNMNQSLLYEQTLSSNQDNLNGVSISKIAIEDTKKPIWLLLPLSDGIDINNTIFSNCSYFDEKAEKWKDTNCLMNTLEGQEPATDLTEIPGKTKLCCARHLTQFSIQTYYNGFFQPVIIYNDYYTWGNFKGYAIAICVFLDVYLLLGFLIIRCIRKRDKGLIDQKDLIKMIGNKITPKQKRKYIKQQQRAQAQKIKQIKEIELQNRNIDDLDEDLKVKRQVKILRNQIENPEYQSDEEVQGDGELKHKIHMSPGILTYELQNVDYNSKHKVSRENLHNQSINLENLQQMNQSMNKSLNRSMNRSRHDQSFGYQISEEEEKQEKDYDADADENNIEIERSPKMSSSGSSTSIELPKQLTTLQKYWLLLKFQHRILCTFYTTENKMYPRVVSHINLISQSFCSLFLIALFASYPPQDPVAYVAIIFPIQLVVHYICSQLQVRNFYYKNREFKALSILIFLIIIAIGHVLTLVVKTGDATMSLHRVFLPFIAEMLLQYIAWDCLIMPMISLCVIKTQLGKMAYENMFVYKIDFEYD
eukprot:403360170